MEHSGGSDIEGRRSINDGQADMVSTVPPTVGRDVMTYIVRARMRVKIYAPSIAAIIIALK